MLKQHSRRTFEHESKERKEKAFRGLNDLVKSRRLTERRGRRVKLKIVALLRMHEQQQERDRRAREKMHRQQEKYSRLLNIPGWTIREVAMRGAMFSSDPIPLSKHEDVTWCKFVVKLHSMKNNADGFHLGVYFNWSEHSHTDDGFVVHCNLRAVAKYRCRLFSDEQVPLLAAARRILFAKYSKILHQASLFNNIDLPYVLDCAYPK